MGALWCCSGLSDDHGFPTLLSGPNNCDSICFCGDLKLRTSPVKFSTQLHILQFIQRIEMCLSVHTNLCFSISGKQRFTLKEKKKGNMERFGRQAMNRGCPACSVRVLNSGKPACISQAYAALTTATVQRAVLRGTVEWQPIGFHLSHFRQGKLIFPQERKLQTDCNHLGLGFPCWFIFLRMSG